MYRWESKSGKCTVRWDAFTTAVCVESSKSDGLSIEDLDDLIKYLMMARKDREDIHDSDEEIDIDNEPDREGPDSD